MRHRNKQLMLARERLGLTRRELAALLSLAWRDYLDVERHGDLPPEVSARLDALDAEQLRSITESAVLSPQAPRVTTRRGTGDAVLGITAVVGAHGLALWNLSQGRPWLGAGFFVVALALQPLAVGDPRCASCGGRLLWSMARDRCPKCGIELGAARRG